MIATIRIDPDDELSTILERLPKKGSCVLVLPPHARGLNSSVGVKLLARRAAERGIALAVVSGDRSVEANVRAANIPFAPTPDEARVLLASAEFDDSDVMVERVIMPQRNDTDDDESPDQSRSPRVTLPDSTPRFAARPNYDTQAHARISSEPNTNDEPSTPEQYIPIAATDTKNSLETSSSKVYQNSAERVRQRANARVEARQRDHTTPQVDEQDDDWIQAASSQVSRILIPTVGLVVVLLLLLWLVSTVWGALFSQVATVVVQPRTAVVTGHTIVRAALNLPPNKQSPFHVNMTRINQSENILTFVPVHGVKLIPLHKAAGTVVLGNLTSSPLTVKAGTLLGTATHANMFVTSKTVVLPSAKISFTSATYPTKVVPINATAGGTVGNVPQRSIAFLDASLTGKIEVTNLAATSGGTSKPISIVDPRDSARIASQNFALMLTRALGDIGRRVGAQSTVHTLFVAESPALSHMSADGHSASMALSLVLHATYIRRESLLPAATSALAVPHSVILVPSSITWSALWNRDNSITLNITGHTLPGSVDPNTLKAGLAGLSRSAALSYLHGRPDLINPSLSLSPSWADHIPNDPNQIHLTIKPAQ